MIQLRALVAADAGGRQAVPGEQGIDQQARAGARLPIDEAQAPGGDHCEAAHAAWVPGRHDEPLLALGEPDQSVTPRPQRTAQSGERGVMEHLGHVVEAGEVGTAAGVCVQGLEAAHEGELDAQRPRGRRASKGSGEESHIRNFLLVLVPGAPTVECSLLPGRTRHIPWPA